MDLIDEIDLAVAFAELILGIDENQATFGSDFLPALEQFTGIVLHDGIVLSRYDALLDDFLARDVHVVTFVGLRRGSDNRLGETLVLFHSFGKLHATQLTAAFFVGSPCTTSEDRADDHLHAESFTLQSHRNHRVGSSKFPVGADVACGIQEFGGNLVEHLSLERNTLGKNHVECRDSVRSNHHHQVVVDVVDVSHLTMVNTLLTIEMEIGFSNCVHFNLICWS